MLTLEVDEVAHQLAFDHTYSKGGSESTVRDIFPSRTNQDGARSLQFYHRAGGPIPE